MTLRRSALATIALVSCGSPDLGDRPALCSDGACPASYACVAGVCTTPGDDIPLTITTSATLRGVDLRIVPQDTTALVVWQTYAYAPEGEGFLGARIDGAGNVGETMQLVTSFEADPGALEPYYDVATTSDGLLLSVAASPLPDDDDPRPRLLVYRVTLPIEGDEAHGATFASAWPAEARLDTIGYGAVSKPRFAGADGAYSLGYLESLTDVDPMTMVGATRAELLVFPLAADGSQLGSPASFDARSTLGLPVAVGVERAWSFDAASWWVLDDERPSVVRVDAATGESQEIALANLGVAESATAAELDYVAPSVRGGEELPTDPVSGPASLHAVTGDTKLVDTTTSSLATTRDTPKPLFVETSHSTLFIALGESATSETIAVSELSSGALTPKLMIDRDSTNPVESVVATAVGDTLFVAWAEVGPGLVTVRAQAVPVPP